MTSRRALDPPAGDVVIVSDELIEQALTASRTSERLRVILPFHKNHEELLHRMINAMQPGTYLQPHRHATPPRSEIFLVLRGAIDLVVFDEAGEITDAITLAAGTPSFGIDLAPGMFHSILVREPDTVVYEVKLGPYTPSSAKDFAPWAPAEGTREAADYQASLIARVAKHRA